jgi:transcriptional regulator with XRE-family HTH domain
MAIEDNPESRTKYGEELRLRREAVGLTQEGLSQRAVMSRTHIAHIEAGRRKPTPEDARRLDQVLETGGIFERFLPALDGRKVAEHFAMAAELERQAVVIHEYAPKLVPGILQTRRMHTRCSASHTWKAWRRARSGNCRPWYERARQLTIMPWGMRCRMRVR